MKYFASVSFGKDSLAMLLKLIDDKMPIDEVVFYDTGMEFKAIYNIRDKILPLLKENNIKYTELKPQQPFLFIMFEKPVHKRNGDTSFGYSWCGGRCRWGTAEKLKTIEKYCYGGVEYVGIAVDEPQRLAKERNGNKIFPLANWNMTEKQCLKYCYDKGFNWLEDGVELYSVLDRVSCWCCCNKNLKELRNYYKYLPSYWSKLKELQSKTNRPMKYNKYSVFDLDKKFNNDLIEDTNKKGDE